MTFACAPSRFLTRRLAFAAGLVAGLALIASTGTLEAKPLTPREIYKKYSKGVVLVFGTDGSAQGSAGTGSIISAEGEVITNAHVVLKNGQRFRKLYVFLKPDRVKGSMKDDLRLRYKAELVAVDEQLDLALLRMVDPPSDLTVIDFVSPDDVDIGEPVVAIGHPETGGLWTLTSGTISARLTSFHNIDGKDVFQTDAAVNRGNSGGPLLNAYGQMVGINTCISRQAPDGLTIESINFSLQSSVPVSWMKRLSTPRDIAYVKPGDPKDEAALALADTVATSPVKPALGGGAAAQTPKPEPIEPKRGQEVADDPEFARAVGQTYVVGRALPEDRAKPEAPTKVRPKHLTKARPYDLEKDLVAQQIRELSDMMEEMSGRIERRPGLRSTRDKGAGIWESLDR